MPELPEMENYRLLLTPRLAGKGITETVVTREKSVNRPVAEFTAEVTGRRVLGVTRRAKHLLFHLEQDKVLVLHLMLGGLMFWGTREERPNRTVQVELVFGADHLYFIGLRLGYLHLHSRGEAEQLLSKLGPEPMEQGFGEQDFVDIISRKRGYLKTALVDQSVLSGIGNCYSDEICFQAGILPQRKIETLQPAELSRLFHAMKATLAEATGYGGYMDMPLYTGDKLTGGFDARCRIYDREGEPCVRCGTPVVRLDFASKKSYSCPGCQH